MINEKRTFEDFGYNGYDLSTWSNKKIWVICTECKKERIVFNSNYNKTSNKCKSCSSKYRQQLKRGPFNIEYFNSVYKSIEEGIINELKTFESFNYYSIDISTGSHKPVWVICDECKFERIMRYNTYTLTSGRCNSCANIGKNNVNYGKYRSYVTRCKISASHQRVHFDQWNGFSTIKQYCSKFDDICKETNREKYNRKCFICGKTELENAEKLSVHHVDMNKAQGCDGHEWKLIPVCRSCHGKLHNKRMQSCIEYILKTL